jgi:hypothetical protein
VIQLQQEADTIESQLRQADEQAGRLEAEIAGRTMSEDELNDLEEALLVAAPPISLSTGGHPDERKIRGAAGAN